MEAASALTALGDEESASDSRASSPANTANKQQGEENSKKNNTTKSKDEKRFLPDHKKPDAALTFPEKVSFVALTLARSLLRVGTKEQPETVLVLRILYRY